MKKRSNFIVIFICFLVISTITLGYSAMNTTLDIRQKGNISPNAVARVGNKYYGSVQDAIDSITDNTETAVYLLKDVNESVTIPQNRNIILNTDSYTLSSNETTITNYGNLTLLNSVVESNGASINVENNYAINNLGNLQIISSSLESNLGGSSYLASGIKSTGAGTIYVENSTIYGSTNGIESSTSIIEIGEKGNLDDTTVITGGVYAVDVGSTTNTFNFNSGTLIGKPEPGYTGIANPPTGYYVYTSLVDEQYVSIIKPIPSVSIKATKESTTTTVDSGVWSNKGLDFTFSVLNDDTNTAKVYYCQDTNNTCEPNTEVSKDTLLKTYENVNGTYYVRYKLVYGDNISTSVQSYEAKVDTVVPSTSSVSASVSYGTSTATLNFSINGADDLTGVSKYILYYKTSNDSSYTSTTITTTNTTASKSITAAQGVTYTYYVVTYDGVDNNSTSSSSTIDIKTYGQSGENCDYTYGDYTLSSSSTKQTTCSKVAATATGTTYTDCVLDSSWTNLGSENVSTCSASTTTTTKVECSSTKYSCSSWSGSSTQVTSCSGTTKPSSCNSTKTYTACAPKYYTIVGHSCASKDDTCKITKTYQTSCSQCSGCTYGYKCTTTHYTKTVYSRTVSTYKTKTSYRKYYTKKVYTRTKTANYCWY